MKVPPCLLFAGIVDQDDRPVLSFQLPVDRLLAPLPERGVVRAPPLQRDVGVLVQSRHLVRAQGLEVALAVLDGILRGVEARGFPKSPPVDAVDLDAKVVATIGIHTVARCHSPLLPFVWGPLRLPGTSRAEIGRASCRETV